MQLAEYPAKLVARNPIPASALPKVRTTVALQFVYPDEDRALMQHEAIPVAYRLLYGFLMRMGWRREEALGGKVEEVDDALDGAEALEDVPPLTWSRIDLRRGVVYIDRDKTNDPRPMPLDPGVRRALEAWREMSPKAKAEDPVFVDVGGRPIDPEGLAEIFRDEHLRPALRAADMDRPELFEPTPCGSTSGSTTRVRRSSQSPSPTARTSAGYVTAPATGAAPSSATAASRARSRSSSLATGRHSTKPSPKSAAAFTAANTAVR
jgi:hypothetical protein